MRVKEANNKGKTKHLCQSELADMCMIKNVSEKAKENFKRKPYDSKRYTGGQNGKKEQCINRKYETNAERNQ